MKPFLAHMLTMIMTKVDIFGTALFLKNSLLIDWVCRVYENIDSEVEMMEAHGSIGR